MNSTSSNTDKLGVVVIGRNEGDRLTRCLHSVVGRARHIVYVDSGSTDGSVHTARECGVAVHELDMSMPFTAARARNDGFSRLLGMAPEFQAVQFVDGDCEVHPGWLTAGMETLEREPDVAVVVGRLRESQPHESLYNRLCDIEWDRPVGEARSCGGNALIRIAAYRQVGGYDPTIIAGEEPELCARLRADRWRVLRIDADMALHDADMQRFGQWWSRAVRAGHAYAEGAWLCGRTVDQQALRPVASIVLWGAFLPAAALLAAWPTHGLSITLVALLYLCQSYRIFRNTRATGRSKADSVLVATFTLLGKFAQLQGLLLFAFRRATGRRTRLIEHKDPAERQRNASEMSEEAPTYGEGLTSNPAGTSSNVP